jgi:CheY-like chemotaxis protein/signal transduction histidine kinase
MIKGEIETMTEWSGKPPTAAEIIDRYRVASLERLARLDATWTRLTADPASAETIAMLDREIHALETESRMVGFTDVDLVARKTADLIDVARERSFQITDDLDVLVTMALRFMTMLIRKRAGLAGGQGIDLPGFVRQIDAVIADTRRNHPPNRDLLSHVVRNRLASVALDLFLDLAGGRESRRVRRGWRLLRDSLAPPDPIPIAPAIARHEAAVAELARELDKELALRFDLATAGTAAPSIVDALDVAALHLLHNAIDHGVESPDERDFALKPREAQITVRCHGEHGRVVLDVIDDGRGVDFVRVRGRAISLGLLEPNAHPTDAELTELLFHPALSTRELVAGIFSGRGVGLDTIASQVGAVGGTVSVRSRPGEGATWTVSIPEPVRRFRVQRFTVRGTPIAFAIPDDWTIAVVPHSGNVIDLVEELAIGPAASRNPITLEISRGDHRVHIAAGGEPQEAEARWLVATGPEAPAGVISIDGLEHLLLRPELLAAASGRVAIVDDSEIVRELVGFSLKPHGIEVLPFPDVKSLVGALAETPADLVLLDPSFKGLDIAGFITRVKLAAPGTLVYLHSDRTPSELAQLAEQARADGYLSKTLGRDQFVARTLKILRSRS